MMALQFLAAAQKSFWEDETVSATVLQGDLNRVLYMDAAVYPPLYYLLSAGWVKLFGSSEVGLRSLSVVCASLCLVVGFQVAQALFGIKSAIFFAVFLVLSPLWLTYAPQARYYALSAAEVMLMVLALVNYQRTQARKWLAVYGLAGTAALYTVYMSFAAHLVCWVWWLGWFVGARKQPRTKLAVEWLLTNVLIAMVFIPWLTTFTAAMKLQADVPAKSLATLASDIAKYMVFNVYDFAVGETLSPLNPVAWVGLGAIALVFGVALARKAMPRASLLALLMVGVPLLATTSISLSMGRIPSTPAPHRTLYALPFFILLLSVGVAALPRRLALVAGMLIASVYGWGQVNFFANREFMKPLLTVPWKELMQIIRSSQTQGAQPVAVICNEADYACFFYGNLNGLNPRWPADWDSIAATRPQEVWWIYSNVSSRGNTDYSQVLATIRKQYQVEEAIDLGAQDASITAFKTRFMQGEAYTHRVNVRRFKQPVLAITCVILDRQFVISR